jgi:hypothetical protein
MSRMYSIERGACDLNYGWERHGRPNRRWKDYIKIDLKEMMQLVYDLTVCQCPSSRFYYQWGRWDGRSVGYFMSDWGNVSNLCWILKMKNLTSPWVDSAWRVRGVKDVLLVVCEAFLSVLTVYTHCSCSEALCRLFSNLLPYQDLGLYWASSSRPPLFISDRVFTECKTVHPSPPHSSKVRYAWNFIPLLILNVPVSSCLEVGAVTSLSSTEWHFECWHSLNYA